MISKVRSIEEAMAYFLLNASGNVLCVDGDREQVVDCYPMAVEFFNQK